MLVFPDEIVVLLHRIKTRSGGDGIGEIFYEELVAIDLVRGNSGLVADHMPDPPGKKPAEGILVEADGLTRAGESGEQAGGGEALHVDNLIVFRAADAAKEGPEIAQLVL